MLTSICIEFPKSLYTVAMKCWKQGFTQTCQWAMAPLLAMVEPVVLKSQNHNINVLHNQKWTLHIAKWPKKHITAYHLNIKNNQVYTQSLKEKLISLQHQAPTKTTMQNVALPQDWRVTRINSMSRLIVATNEILGANCVVATLPSIPFGTCKQQSNGDEEYASLTKHKPK